MNRCITLLSLVFFLPCLCTDAHADSPSYLAKCWEKQVAPLRDRFFSFHYQEQQNRLYHSPEPWQLLPVQSEGSISCSRNSFYQCDTIANNGKLYVSATQFSPTELLIQPYWSKSPVSVTKGRLAEQKIVKARYSPILLLDYFIEHRPLPDTSSEAEYAVYTLDINKTVVRLFIRKADCLVEKVTTMQHDDLLGDVTETTMYEDIVQHEGLSYARRIRIEKMQNIREEVTVSAIGLVPHVTPLLETPAHYSIEEDQDEAPLVTVEKIADNIYSVQLWHAETQSLLVEFKDFFVVVDVPLSSENGELVVQEAHRIAPGKPVKYYAFGHHHPWYIGGVRPFIHKGTTVLCRKENLAYVEYIAQAPHTLQPDSLSIQPQPLKTQLLDSVTTITDGSFEMKIYHIGMQSTHTSDYLLFYFPSEKLVYEGDLAWIPISGSVKKAGRTQMALYNSIRRLGLDVATIAQTWPLGEKHETKSRFSFSELEQSALVE